MNLNDNSEREIWLDNIKSVACILVVLGHFFQSMIKADIWMENAWYEWFEQTIYFFHVPLFFMCSGYLYQRYSKVNSFESWKRNVLKKFVVLGVPYCSFTTITWILKMIFPDSVNSPVENLFDVLLKSPMSPYWYLYSLFFIFMIIPTFSEKVYAYVGVGMALILKMYAIYVGGCSVYAISTIINNTIWFVIGMFLCMVGFENLLNRIFSLCVGSLLLTLFLCISVFIYLHGINSGMMNTAMGAIACLAVFLLTHSMKAEGELRKFERIGMKYSFPIFLMHTIFAAAIRIVLIELEIRNAGIHTVLGLSASFIGPIIATKIMERCKWMEFFMYPGKYIKFNKVKL